MHVSLNNVAAFSKVKRRVFFAGMFVAKSCQLHVHEATEQVAPTSQAVVVLRSIHVSIRASTTGMLIKNFEYNRGKPTTFATTATTTTAAAAIG